MAMDDSAPLFDPRGVYWRVNRENVLLLGGGAALLLQIAHPLVAAGVFEHSGFREQPVRRLYATVAAMQEMTYGSRASALAAARRINEIHRRVHGRLPVETTCFPRGTRYDARDPALLLWVHSTLVATALEAYQAFFPALRDEECEAYYQEAMTVALLLGLRRRDLPTDVHAFREYYRGMLSSDVLEVTPITSELARHIIHPPISWVPHIAGDVLSIATAALLPERLRHAYGLRWSPRRAMAWDFTRRAVRRLIPYVPDLVRTGHRAWWVERRLDVDVSRS
jgi:uncharacterized protein (DUF2236 family)